MRLDRRRQPAPAKAAPKRTGAPGFERQPTTDATGLAHASADPARAPEARPDATRPRYPKLDTTRSARAIRPASSVTPSSASHAVLSSGLTAIIEAAEQSAEEMRSHAEERARERIAEADRASAYRVQAAEEEATEIVASALSHAKQVTAEAADDAAAIQAKARASVAEAQEKAKQIIDRARDQAREIVGAAHTASGAVLAEGTEISTNLHELSQSLRNNAERLLRDIRVVHGTMATRLEQATPSRGASRASREAAAPSGERQESASSSRTRPRLPLPPDSDDLGVPEFLVPEP
jgi:vacuolar-type H+-ATPase subunit H